jgi:serine/threonine-protein kinase PpkA
VRCGDIVGDGLRVDARLGGGSNAEVWRASTPLGTPVAIKLPRPVAASAMASAALIRHEHAMLARFDHPNVLSTFGLMEIDGQPALITEYCGAGDLVSLLGGPPRHWVRAVHDVGAALLHLHRHGVVHRDVKPRNVLFRDDNSAVLIDFALALPAGAATVGHGTPVYRRPDRAAEVGPEDDLYAFAVVLHELMAGALPDREPGRSAELSPSPWRPLGSPEASLVELEALTMAELRASHGAAGSLSRLVDVLESAIRAES